MAVLLPGDTEFGKLKWAPPVLDNPSHFYVTNTTPNAILDYTKDWIVHLPADSSITVKNGFQIVGGRNVVCIGGSVNHPTDYGKDDALGNRVLLIRGDIRQTVPRTVHVEGIRASGHVREGINIDSQSEPGLTVQLQNLNFVDSILGAADDNHADFVQTWNGPWQLRMHRCYSKSTYQTFMFGPKQYGSSPIGDWHIEDVFADMTDDAGTFGYMIGNGGYPNVTLKNVYVRRPNRTSPPAVLSTSTGLVALTVWGGTAPIEAPSRMISPVSGYPGYYYRSPGYRS